MGDRIRRNVRVLRDHGIEPGLLHKAVGSDLTQQILQLVISHRLGKHQLIDA